MQDLIYFIEFYWAILLLIIILILFIKNGYGIVIYCLFIGFLTIYSGGRIIDGVIIGSCIFLINRIYCGIRENRKEAKKPKSPFRATLITDRNKKIIIENVNAGVSIFAASGGGKSVGPIYQLLQHYSENGFAGIVNDYKNYELTDILYPLFKKQGIKVAIWAAHDVNRSVRINPLAPRYIEKESDLKQIAHSLMINLFPSSGGDSQFFVNAATSVFCAVAWRLKEDHPEKCNLPFIISILMSYKALDKEEHAIPNPIVKPYGKLIDFITVSPRATVIGNMFLSGIANERQTGSVMSSLADGLSKLASPELFYLLAEDEFNLAINADNNRHVLSVVNYPKNASFITPINAMVMECAFAQMSERDRKPSFVVLDEAPTIRLEKLGTKVSTLRSYNISFVYCLQDKVQGLVQNNGKEYIIKEILANLSVQFMGKVNDPDTGKYYEKFFEMIPEEQFSFNKGDGGFLEGTKGEARTTTSYKDVSLHKSFEFFLLKAGEFVMFSAGKATKFRFKYDDKMAKELPLPSRQITQIELDQNYLKLLEEGAEFISNI